MIQGKKFYRYLSVCEMPCLELIEQHLNEVYMAFNIPGQVVYLVGRIKNLFGHSMNLSGSVMVRPDCFLYL